MAENASSRLLVGELIWRCSELTKQLNSLQPEHFASDVGRQLRGALLEAVDHVSLQVRSIELDAAAGASIEELFAASSKFHAFLMSIDNQWLPLLGGAVSSATPFEVTVPIERIAKKLLGESQFIFNSVRQLNYSLLPVGQTLRDEFALMGLQEILVRSGLTPILHQVDVAAAPPGGVLCHAILAHEIGHALYVAHRAEDRLVSTAVLPEQYVIDIAARDFPTVERLTDGSSRPIQLVLSQMREAQLLWTRARLKKIVVQWLEELYCDAVGVVLLGPAYVCAMGEMAVVGGDIDRATESHPPDRLRLDFALRVLIQSDDRGMNYKSMRDKRALPALASMLAPWKSLLDTAPSVQAELEADAARATIDGSRSAVIQEVTRTIPAEHQFRRTRFQHDVPQLVEKLLNGIPPTERIVKRPWRIDAADLPSILNAGWVVYVKSHLSNDSPFDASAMNRFQRLMTKSLEDSELRRGFSVAAAGPPLTGQPLGNRLFGDVPEHERLIVTPLLEPESQIKEGSEAIDLRLGSWFLIQERSEVSKFDAADPNFEAAKVTVDRTFRIPYGSSTLLHPGQFILGSTLEFLALPGDMRGYVIGRSGWGRLGLVIATATGVNPYYKGCLTLELANVGEVPITLWPGVAVAQLFFHHVELQAPGPTSPYSGSTRPESSHLDLRQVVGRLKGMSSRR